MNETKLQAPTAWKLVPVEPTQEMFAAARTSASGSNTEKLLMASYWRNMLAAAPAPATWSSATAPGPDGMQHCIAVPGMPSAARDAVLDEAAAICDKMHGAGPNTALYVAGAIRRLKSIAGPVTAARPPSAHDDISAQLREYASNPGYSHNDYADTMRQAADAIDAGLDAIRSWSTHAPVQQAAPSALLLQNLLTDVGALLSEFVEDGAALKRREARALLARVRAKAAALAAPAQPVGLSEQDKLDAAFGALDHPLLRQLLGDIEDSNTPEATRLWSLVSAWAEVRDAAILAAKGGAQ